MVERYGLWCVGILESGAEMDMIEKLTRQTGAWILHGHVVWLLMLYLSDVTGFALVSRKYRKCRSYHMQD